MSRYDSGNGVWRQQQQIERLAERDVVFAVNYGALVRNAKFRQLKPTVTQWLIRSALARERREGQRFNVVARSIPRSVEQELFGEGPAVRQSFGRAA